LLCFHITLTRFLVCLELVSLGRLASGWITDVTPNLTWTPIFVGGRDVRLVNSGGSGTLAPGLVVIAVDIDSEGDSPDASDRVCKLPEVETRRGRAGVGDSRASSIVTVRLRAVGEADAEGPPLPLPPDLVCPPPRLRRAAPRPKDDQDWAARVSGAPWLGVRARSSGVTRSIAGVTARVESPGVAGDMAAVAVRASRAAASVRLTRMSMGIRLE
jgi:hypothetical protein